MKEIHGGASYVRNFDTAPQVVQALSDQIGADQIGADQIGAEQALLGTLANDITPPEALGRIWDLLETPQTVETICRVLSNEFDLPPAASAETVKLVLLRLYRDDLIQLSPDT